MAAQFSVDSPAGKLAYLQTFRQYAVQTGFDQALDTEGPAPGMVDPGIGAANDATALRYLVTACGTTEMAGLVRDASTAWEAWELLQMAYGAETVTDAYARYMALNLMTLLKVRPRHTHLPSPPPLLHPSSPLKGAAMTSIDTKILAIEAKLGGVVVMETTKVQPIQA